MGQTLRRPRPGELVTLLLPGPTQYFTPNIPCPGPQPTTRLWADAIWKGSPGHLESDISVPGIPQSSEDLGAEAGGQTYQDEKGRKAVLLSCMYPEAGASWAHRALGGPPGRAEGRAHRLVHLGGTVPASSGHSPGFRDRQPHLGRKQRQSGVTALHTGSTVPATQPLPHRAGQAWLWPLFWAGPSSQPPVIRTRKTNSPKTYWNAPAPPTPQSPLSRPEPALCTKTDSHCPAAPSSPRQGRAALQVQPLVSACPKQASVYTESPRGWGLGFSLRLRSSKECWLPSPPHTHHGCPSKP